MAMQQNARPDRPGRVLLVAIAVVVLAGFAWLLATLVDAALS